MADPTLTQNFLIKLGDGGDPTEAFAWACGISVRSATFTNNVGEAVTLDCSDPIGEAAAIQRWVESQDTQLSFSGRVSLESWDMWRVFADTGAVKNVRIELDEAGADGGGYWTLPCILTQMEIGAEDKSTATFTASLIGAGRRVWTDAS